MVDILLASLLEALKAQGDLQTGNTDLQDANESSDRFIHALSSVIDERVNYNIEERRKLKSQERAKEKSVIVLASAPQPINDADLDDIDYVRAWFKQYKVWYQLSTGRA